MYIARILASVRAIVQVYTQCTVHCAIIHATRNVQQVYTYDADLRGDNIVKVRRVG